MRELSGLHFIPFFLHLRLKPHKTNSHLLGTAQIHTLLQDRPSIDLGVYIRRGRCPIQRVDLLRDVAESLGGVHGAFVVAGDGIDCALQSSESALSEKAVFRIRDWRLRL